MMYLTEDRSADGGESSDLDAGEHPDGPAQAGSEEGARHGVDGRLGQVVAAAAAANAGTALPVTVGHVLQVAHRLALLLKGKLRVRCRKSSSRNSIYWKRKYNTTVLILKILA